MAKQTTYHAIGSVRGACGHLHRTITAAARCKQRDMDACGRLGGGAYSDRQVARIDGEPLSESEIDYLHAIHDEMAY